MMDVCRNCFYWHKTNLCLKKFLPVGSLCSCENFWSKNSSIFLPIRNETKRKLARETIKQVIDQWLKKGFCVPPVPVEIKASSSQSVSVSVKDFLRVLKFLLEKKVERRVYLRELVKLEYSNPSRLIRRNGRFFYF